MGFLRRLLDRAGGPFQKGRALHKLHPLYEAVDTLLYTPSDTASGAVHVRDAINLKRMMVTVVIALVPSMVMGMYNTGLQAHRALALGARPLERWQETLYAATGLGYAPTDVFANLVHGAVYFIPIYVVCLASGGFWEVLFAAVRKHEVAEGFFVTSALVPLIVPATVPLWQIALATSFGVVLGKEVFGGVGMNIFNPAMLIRAFLFFAYPADISGDTPWTAADFSSVDGVTGATWLSKAAAHGVPGLEGLSWWDAFVGTIPGSMGETSALAALIGCVLLLVTRIASWRTMLGVTLGTLALALLFNALGSQTNPMFGLPFHWHVVLGGWAVGTVFMATDPVTAPYTPWAQLLYGLGIGALTVLVRVVNPAYPEGMMLAVLFMNMFAPLLDHGFVRANIKRREARLATR